ncbi:methyltransferase domain-containing protein [Pseudomarimonas arenosa]|uniref:Methyltransferase domain-containing protein n=1 Tax=Pseudomarimonas arenosa TaxID=2774145 RepID=A0AAW3ZNQ1_9GAMM|nr:methyltransferase domain-containing protein [Pseudomarimonas arenosa]MBD8527135.1 methyltransferase domain-containing protein [Pseudomarimonas arenosa]
MYLLNPRSTDDTDALYRRFHSARPFRHWLIEDFFNAEWADRLIAEFPDFERGNARNENGELGGKSVVERIRDLGPAYAALDDLAKSPAFLSWLSASTGIPDLLYDPEYFGGGTHDNRHGQDLDVHVDFNRHPGNGSHRRLNLIVYLNKDWQPDWGGGLELHSDPRSEADQVSIIQPLFNHCVVFETTEHSWHGFSRITLPEAEHHRSRKSIALYFYTASRPSEEVAPTHSTIYVDRPLPERFHAGHVLSEADLQEIKGLLARRDQHNQRLYRELTAAQNRVALLEQSAGGNPFGHAARFWNGSLRFASRLGAADRAPMIREARDAFLPFVSHLPPLVRQPLRRMWRRMQKPAPASVVADASPATTATTQIKMKCVLCGNEAAALQQVGAVAPTHPGPFQVNEYRLLHCANCDTVRLDPTPNAADLNTLYCGSVQFSDDTYTAPERVAQILDYYTHCLTSLKLLPKPGGRCLEVGAGLAWVSRGCKQLDTKIHTTAQDLSDECSLRCPWVDSYRVVPVEELATEQRYALISLTHVIEHVPDPEVLLGELNARLENEGKIFITAPFRPIGWQPNQGISAWNSYSYLHVPAHISYLSKRWFDQVCQRLGLAVLHWSQEQDGGQAFEVVLGKASAAAN